MYVELEPQEKDLLVELVEARLREIGPEIRRSRDSKFHDQMQEQQRALQQLLSRLHETSYDVTS